MQQQYPQFGDPDVNPKSRAIQQQREIQHHFVTEVLQQIHHHQTHLKLKFRKFQHQLSVTASQFETKETMPPKPMQVHLPPFLRRDVGLWFMQVEALFRTAQINDEQAKYDFVLAALDIVAATEVRELLENPPEANKFQELKKALMNRMATSEETRIRQVLANQEIGDRKPSAFLRELKAKAGDNFSPQVLASIWKEALPADVQMILAGNSETPVETQAELADKVMGIVSKTSRQVSAVSKPDDQIAELTKQISALGKTISTHMSRFAQYRETGKQDKKPESANRETGERRGEKRQRSRSRSRSRNRDTEGLCWYHARFGDKARKCEEPCSKSLNPVSENSETRQ